MTVAKKAPGALPAKAFRILNQMGNCCVSLFYAYNLLYDIVCKDSLLTELATELKARSLCAQVTGQKCIDLLFSRGRTFVLNGPQSDCAVPSSHHLTLAQTLKMQTHLEGQMHDLLKVAVEEKDADLLNQTIELNNSLGFEEDDGLSSLEGKADHQLSPQQADQRAEGLMEQRPAAPAESLIKDDPKPIEGSDKNGFHPAELKHVSTPKNGGKRSIKKATGPRTPKAPSDRPLKKELPAGPQRKASINKTAIKKPQQAGGSCQEKDLEKECQEKLDLTHPIDSAMIIKKPGLPEVTGTLYHFLSWVLEQALFQQIYVEEALTSEEHVRAHKALSALIAQKCSLFSYKDKPPHVDVLIVLGGDGTLLHACSLFPNRIPPVIPFKLGKVNYLMPFSFEEETYKAVLGQVISKTDSQELRCCQHQRIRCTLLPHGMDQTALNDIVVHRGDNCHMISIRVCVEGHFVTSFSCDGLIVSTPTGSTAYSMSAGGSIMHPHVKALQVIPICAHSLGARALVVPFDTRLSLLIEKGSGLLSVDGTRGIAIGPQESVEVRSSEFPLALVHPCPKPEEACAPSWLHTLRWMNTGLCNGPE